MQLLFHIVVFCFFREISMDAINVGNIWICGRPFEGAWIWACGSSINTSINHINTEWAAENDQNQIEDHSSHTSDFGHVSEYDVAYDDVSSPDVTHSHGSNHSNIDSNEIGHLGYDGSYDSMDSGSDSFANGNYEDRRLILARNYGYRLKGVEVDAFLHVALCEIETADECPGDIWIRLPENGDSCYRLRSQWTAFSWNEAVDFCGDTTFQGQVSHLAVLESQEEFNHIQEWLQDGVREYRPTIPIETPTTPNFPVEIHTSTTIPNQESIVHQVPMQMTLNQSGIIGIISDQSDQPMTSPDLSQFDSAIDQSISIDDDLDDAETSNMTETTDMYLPNTDSIPSGITELGLNLETDGSIESTESPEAESLSGITHDDIAVDESSTYAIELETDAVDYIPNSIVDQHSTLTGVPHLESSAFAAPIEPISTNNPDISATETPPTIDTSTDPNELPYMGTIGTSQIPNELPYMDTHIRDEAIQGRSADNRASAIALGTIALFIVASVVTGIFLLDLPTYVVHLRKMRADIKSFIRYYGAFQRISRVRQSYSV